MKQKSSITRFRRDLSRSVHLATLGQQTEDIQRVLIELHKKQVWLTLKLLKRMK